MEKALKILKRLKEVGAISVSEKISSEAIAELKAMKPKTCKWKQCTSEYDTHWDGSCGIGWMLTEGTPSYNGMKFCPQCGGKLIEIEPKDNA